MTGYSSLSNSVQKPMTTNTNLINQVHNERHEEKSLTDDELVGVTAPRATREQIDSAKIRDTDDSVQNIKLEDLANGF